MHNIADIFRRPVPLPAHQAAPLLQLVNKWIAEGNCPEGFSLCRGGDNRAVLVVDQPIAALFGANEPGNSLALAFDLSEPWDGGSIPPAALAAAFRQTIPTQIGRK